MSAGDGSVNRVDEVYQFNFGNISEILNFTEFDLVNKFKIEFHKKVTESCACSDMEWFKDFNLRLQPLVNPEAVTMFPHFVIDDGVIRYQVLWSTSGDLPPELIDGVREFFGL